MLRAELHEISFSREEDTGSGQLGIEFGRKDRSQGKAAFSSQAGVSNGWKLGSAWSCIRLQSYANTCYDLLPHRGVSVLPLTRRT